MGKSFPRTIHERFIAIEEAQEYILKRARREFDMFVYTISIGTMKLYPIHKKWFDVINDPQNQYINISTFPGCGKTTLMQYWIAWRIGQEPYLTWMVICSSFEKATERISAIRKIIELPMYKMIFPHISIDYRQPDTRQRFSIWSSKWHYEDENVIDYQAWRTLVSLWGELKEATVSGYGIMSDSILGARITGAIVMDDIHNQKNVLTEEQRNKVYNIVQGNIKSRLTMARTKKAHPPKLINICNRWHPNDTAGRLAELVREDGKPVWVNINTPIHDEDGNPTYPEKFDTETIKRLREEQGGETSISWRLNYLVDPSGASNKAFELDRLRRPLPEPLPELAEIIITTDFAHTQTEEADYTVFTAVAKDKEKPFNIYILDIERFKLSQISEKIARLIKFYEHINNTYGQECGVRAIVFENRDGDAERQFLQSQAPHIPTAVVRIKTNKAVRLGEFEGYVQSGKVFFNTNMRYYGVMVSELMDFPAGKHDDICDTLSMPFLLDDWTRTFGRAGVVFAKVDGKKLNNIRV